MQSKPAARCSSHQRQRQRNQEYAIIVVAAFASVATPAHAQQADAYQQGVELAGSVDSNVAADPNSPNLVPGYTPNPPQAQYYTNPGQMETDGATQMQNSEVGQFVSTDEDTRPAFVIDPNTDPMIQRATTTATNADAITGTYTGCTQMDQVTPGTTTTEACQEYRPPEQHTCSNTLNVNVQRIDTATCNLGSTIAYNYTTRWIREGMRGQDGGSATVFCDPYRTDGMLNWYFWFEDAGAFNIPIALQPQTPISSDPWTTYDKTFIQMGGGRYGLYITGGCDGADNCNYRYYHCLPPYWMTWCNPDGFDCYSELMPGECHFAGDIAFQRPRVITTWNVTDSWSNQCATFQARTP